MPRAASPPYGKNAWDGAVIFEVSGLVFIYVNGVDDVRDRLHDCTTDISNWCASRRLQLNEGKTELAWFGKRSRLVQLASMKQTVTVGASVIHPSSVVRDLGVLLDQ